MWTAGVVACSYIERVHGIGEKLVWHYMEGSTVIKHQDKKSDQAKSLAIITLIRANTILGSIRHYLDIKNLFRCLSHFLGWGAFLVLHV